MLLNAGCQLSVDAQAISPVILMLRPQSGQAQQVTAADLTFTPMTPVHEFRDGFGNSCQRILLQPGRTEIKSTCTVESPDEIDAHPQAGYTLIQDLPDDVLTYLLPSRYCQHDLLQDLAKEVAGAASPGYGQADAIRAWIRQNIAYEYGTSNASTSAVETSRTRTGVCRDYAHMGIALCRALRIPARMVMGYLLGLDPMDLHAWFEAFVGGRWYTFDPTQPEPRGNRIVMGFGRDAADIAHMSEYGPAKISQMSVWVNQA